MHERFISICILVVCCFVAGFGCSDAERAKFGGIGSTHSIKCYSGGVVIYNGNSKGKVLSAQSSDGYYFEEESTGKLKEVSGSCVITRL